MKLERHSNSLATNVEGQSRSFGIGNASKIISILRNKLYEHKARSLVQEYVSNARDSHRQASRGNDFEITVPTKLNPVFKVKDFGVGLSPDDMTNVFCMYGSSTKEHTNDLTGGLGLGSKSAWAYTDSFSVVSTTNGIRRTYIAHTGLDNNGRLDLISEDNTGEPTGVEIQVAVKPDDVREFRDAVWRAIYFWDVRPTVKGDFDYPTQTIGYKINDNIELIDRNNLPEFIECNWNSPLAIIDGIPYPISDGLVNKLSSLSKINQLINKRLVLRFGNGLVEVAASRESIADSPKSVSALESMCKKTLMVIQTHLTEEFGKVNSPSEFFATYAKLKDFFYLDKFAKYDSYSIEYASIVSPLLADVAVTKVSMLNRRGRVSTKARRDEFGANKHIDLKWLDCLYFTDSNESKVIQNRRISELLKTHKEVVVIRPDIMKASVGGKKSFDKLVKDLNVKNLLDIPLPFFTKAARVLRQKQDEEICLHRVGYGRHFYVKLATNTQKWFYLELKDGDFPMDKSILSELDSYLYDLEGARICALSPKTVKTVEDDKNFSPLTDYLANYNPTLKAIRWVMSDLSKNSDDVSVVNSLKDLDDDFLVEMGREYKDIQKNCGHVPSILASKIVKLDEVKEFAKKDTELTKLISEQYPLIRALHSGSRNIDELTFYINAKYNADKKGKK